MIIEKCIICSNEYEYGELWISSNHPWMKLCKTCWKLPYEEQRRLVKEYAEKNEKVKTYETLREELKGV